MVARTLPHHPPAALTATLLTLCLSAMGVLPASGLSTEPRLLTADDVLALRRPSDPRISPRGDWVAFVVEERSAEGARAPEIWLVSTEGDDRRRVSDNPGPDVAPRWFPDGKTLGFLSRRPGERATSILLYDLAGGVHRSVPGTEGARDFEVSPGGDRLAFTRTDPPGPQAEERRRGGDDARVVGRDPEHTRLWLRDLESGGARPLGRRDATVWHFSWSPDGSAIAALASSSPIAEGHEYGSQLVLLNVDSGEQSTLAEHTHPQASPAFSADGEWIAYLGPVGDFKERGIIHLVRRRGGAPRRLLPDYRGNVWDLAWHPREPLLIAAMAEGVEHYFVEVDLEGKARRLLPLHRSIIPYWEQAWDLSADGAAAAFLSEDGGGAEELWFSATTGSSRRRLTYVNDFLLGVELGAVEGLRWTHPQDDTVVEGILVKPPAPAASSGPLPLIVWLHGGPAYNWGLGAQVRSWAQLFASRGYLVLLPNFRGSSGYGMEWMTANVRDWGDGPLGDVQSGVDHLVKTGLADPDRLYVGGGSYGGYLTLWIIGHSDRFKAAFVRAGVTDLASEYALTDEPSFLVGYFQGTPFDAPEAYRQSSPITYAKDIKTPLLMVHGERDLRVPLSQSQQLYAALEHYGATVELVIYPREGHGIREPAHRRDLMSRALAWFERWR